MMKYVFYSPLEGVRGMTPFTGFIPLWRGQGEVSIILKEQLNSKLY